MNWIELEEERLIIEIAIELIDWKWKKKKKGGERECGCESNAEWKVLRIWIRGEVRGDPLPLRLLLLPLPRLVRVWFSSFIYNNYLFFFVLDNYYYYYYNSFFSYDTSHNNKVTSFLFFSSLWPTQQAFFKLENTT